MIKAYAVVILLLSLLFVAVKYLFKCFTEKVRMNRYLAYFLAFILGSALCGALLDFYYVNFYYDRSKVAPVSVITTLHDREGLTEKDFDIDMLKNNEKLVVDTSRQQARQIYASRGNDPSKFNPYPVSESHFVTIDGRKLGIINMAVYSSKGDRTSIVKAIRIMGFTSKGIETVNCIRKGDDDISAFSGECGEKIRQIFRVNIPKF